MDQARGTTTNTNRGRGLKTKTVKGMVIVTNLGRDLEETTEDKRRGMISKKDVRIIIAEVIIIREMAIQVRKGVKNKRCLLDITPRSKKDRKEVHKEMAIGLPHASNVVN